jgi:hypothetical protein
MARVHEITTPDQTTVSYKAQLQTRKGHHNQREIKLERQNEEKRNHLPFYIKSITLFTACDLATSQGHHYLSREKSI